MRKLTLTRFVRLHGVVRSPGARRGPERRLDHGGWSFEYWDEQMEGAMGEPLSKPFEPVLGRKSHENDDRRAPDAGDGLRDCGGQHELSAPGFPAHR